MDQKKIEEIRNRKSGYGTTIDNYKAQQEKKRKEEEKAKGPVSTQRLSLPKAEAPVSTQRMGTTTGRASLPSPAVMGATGRQSPALTQSEFNRSTAMIKSYGNYDNYLAGRRVTAGGFYSRSGADQDSLDYRANQANMYWQAFDRAAQDYDKNVQSFRKLTEPTAADNFGLRSPLKEAKKREDGQKLEQQATGVAKLWDAYQARLSEYENEKAAYDQWRDSARTPDQIQADISARQKEIETWKKEIRKYNSAATFNNTLGDIAQNVGPMFGQYNLGAGALENAMNAQDMVRKYETLIENALEDINLLNEELEVGEAKYWQDYINGIPNKDVQSFRKLTSPTAAENFGVRSPLRDMAKKESAKNLEKQKNEQKAAARDMRNTRYNGLDVALHGINSVVPVFSAIDELTGNTNIVKVNGIERANLNQVTPEEWDNYEKIAVNSSPEDAQRYLEYLNRTSLNARRRDALERGARQNIEDNPWYSDASWAALSTLTTPLKVSSFIGQTADMLVNGKMEKDAPYNDVTYWQGATRGAIANDADKWAKSKFGNDTIKIAGKDVKPASFATQSAMSVLDNLYLLGLTGGFELDKEALSAYNQGTVNLATTAARDAAVRAENANLLTMGFSAAPDAVIEAKDRGLSDSQAYILGAAAGMFEILTEKVSLDALLEGLGNKNMGAYLLTQGFTEGSEEINSGLLNTVLDVWVSQDQSEWRQAIKKYEKDGLSKDDAVRAAFEDKMFDLAQEGAAGMLSGFAMSGGMMISNAGHNAVDSYNQYRNAITSEQNVNGIIKEGLAAKENTPAYKAAENLKAQLESGDKLTVREVKNAATVIDAQKRTDNSYVSEKIKEAEQYKRTTAYALAANLKSKLSNNEEISVREVNTLERKIAEAKFTSADKLESVIETAKADPDSAAYKSAVKIEQKLKAGQTVSVREAMRLRSETNEALNEAFDSKNADVIGSYMISESGRKALTDAATILKNSTSQSDIRRGNEMLQAIRDGNLDAKTAGEVFLRSQNILENTRNQTARVLQPREVTADMDAYDRSAAELGVSEEEASHNKAIMQAFGVEGEYKAFENNNLSAYYDRSTGKVYINANAQNPGLALIAHEVTHSFENTAAYRKLADLVFSQSKDLNADLQRITQKYKDAGINLDDEGARSELVSEFVEQHMFNDEKFIKDVVSTDRSLAQKFLSAIDNLLAKLGNKNAQQRQLLREARDLWAEALQQRKTSDKAKAKIAEKRSDGKLSLPKAESKQYAISKATVDSSGRDLTDDQLKYFDRSKIRNKDGQLLTMYHGTTAWGEITKFKRGKSGWLGPGIYMTSRKSDAQRYADAMGPGNGTLYEVYANVTNPLVVTTADPVKEILSAIYGNERTYNLRLAKNGNLPSVLTSADIKKLQAKGYDGIRWDYGGTVEVSVFDQNQIKRTDNQHPTSSPDVRYAISKSDTAYLRAVESGDTETAQRLVDEAAKAAGYTVKGYHGTGAKFTIFDKSRSGQNWRGDSRYGPGLYFAHDAKTASKWTDGSRIVDAWLSIQNPIDLRKDAPEDIVKAIKERTKQKATQYEDWFPVSREQYLQNLERNESYDIKNVGSFLMDFKYDKNGKMTDGIREFLQGLGYDGIISDGEIVVFDPSQIKSADPVTYDDSGNPIPLSERFNPNNPDIRYAVNKAATLYRTEYDFSEEMPIDEFRDLIKKESSAKNYFPKGLSEQFVKAISAKALFNKTKVYRGIDENELMFLLENKFLKSNSSYNFSFQEGQTLGDEDPGYALSYATGFAPKEIADRHYKGGSPTYLVEYINSPDLNIAKNNVNESYTYDNIDQDYITRIFEITYDPETEQDMVRDVTDDFRSDLPNLGNALAKTAHGQPMFYQDKTTGTILYAAQGKDGWENGRYISQYDAENNFGEPIVFSYDQIKNGLLTRNAMRMFKISGNESDLVPMKIGADGTLEVDGGNNSTIRYAINKDATIRTESELIDSVIDPKETAKAGVENALDSYLDSIGAGSDIPGMDKISTGTKRNAKLPAKYKAQDAARFFYRKMVDSGEAVTRLGRYSNDPHLYHYYNMARASSNAAVSMIQDAQTDVMGRRVGDSLNDIFSSIRKKGEQYYADLQAYLYHTHNIDRMSRENPGAVAGAQAELEQFRRDNPELANMADFQIERMASDPISFYHDQAKAYMQILRRLQQAATTHNKPVFGQDVTAEQSRRAAEDLREKLSETEGFEEDVEKIYQYIDNLMQYRIDSGLITEDEYERLKEIYPHYVPTFREQEPTARNKRGNTTEIGKTVGRAQGGDTRLIPLHRALAQQTFSVVREGSKNRFGQMLLEGKQNSSRGMIKNVEEAESGFHEDTFDEEDPTPTKENTFIVRQGGKRYEIGMDNALYEAVTALSPEPSETNFLINMVHKSNDLFKALCTGYNPTFLVRNFMRDLQDAGLYSKDLSEFSKQYPLAYKEITTNGKYWQMYKALGGLYSSFFDYQTGELKQSGKVKKYTVDAIESVNMAVEQAPRLAEFMATVKKAEKAGNLSIDTLMEAIYNAADVTVNFGRSGKWGKMFNRSVVPFFNPGVQGFDKMIRNVTETKGFKDWARLAAKATILGIAPAVISRLLFGKRKDWDEIKQRDKDIYYLFPLQDGVWLKLPKGRVLSVFGMAADRIMQGKDADWASFIETSLTQTAPENPLTASYWRPWLDAKLFDKDDPGKTWYGSDIENQRLRNLAPGQRYDTTTDALSKWLGKTFNLSPKKINYLLDQYSGVIGDVLLPLTSDRAEKGLFTNAFTIDSVVSNQLSEDFYDMKDRLTWAKNDPNATGEDEALYKYWNEQTSAISDINKAIRAIEQDKSLTDKEKRDLTRVQYSLRNGIMRNALDSMKDYRAGGTDNDIYSKVSDAQAQEERESKTYNFKGQDVAWDDLSGTQKKIVQAQDAIDNDPNADLSEIIGKGNATKKLAQYQAARDQGISNQTYIDALQAIDDADDGNGNYNQAEAKAGLDKLISDGTISEKEAGTLWKIITGGADKNNPFPVGAIRPMGLRLPKIG